MAAATPARGAQLDHVGDGDFGARLAPRLAWITKEKIRAGYNYCPPIEYYSLAEQCGMNAIIARIEIANDPSGDEGLRARLKPGQRTPHVLESLDLLVGSSRAAKQLGLHFFYMLNTGGSMGNVKDGFRGNPRRYNNGDTFSPMDDVYWTRVVEARFLRVARMLEPDEFQIDGFMIDPEMYALGGRLPGDVDYGDFALGEFMAAQGVKLDFKAMSIAERRGAIEQRGLARDLYQFQFERVKALAQRTRERVHAVHPDAIFGVITWRDWLWYKAVAAGFATERTPFFVGPESTYPGSFDGEFVKVHASVRQQAGVPILFVPGLRFGLEGKPPAVPTEHMKVLPGNLYHRAINTHGYWFWALTRMGRTPEQRKPFLDVLRRVNNELDKHLASGGKYGSPLKPAPLPTGEPPGLQELLVDVRSWRPLPASALPVDPPPAVPVCFRGLHTFVLHAGAAEEFVLHLRNRPLGRYTAPTACTLYRPDGAIQRPDDIPLGQTRRLSHEADHPSLWLAGVTSHNNAFVVLPGTRGAAIVERGSFRLSGNARSGTYRLFFYVPKGTKSFVLSLRGHTHEWTTFRVFDSAGTQLLEERELKKQVQRTVSVRGHDGKVWWIETSEMVDDLRFALEGIPNIVALRPQDLLAPRK